MGEHSTVEDSVTETAHGSRAWGGSLDADVSADIVSWKHSVSAFAEEGMPQDGSDAEAAAREPAAASPSTLTSLGAAQAKSNKRQHHAYRGLAAAAAAAFPLLLLAGLSVRSKVERLPTHTQVIKPEGRSTAELAELESAARGAATKLQYLQQVAAAATGLAYQYKTCEVAQALEKIHSAVSDAKEHERDIRLHLERWQQREQQKQQQVQEHAVTNWVVCSELVDLAYSSGVTAAHDLLKALLPPLSAHISNLSESTMWLKATCGKTQRLCKDASAKLGPGEANLLEAYLVAVQLGLESVQDEVLTLQTARARFEDQLRQQAKAGASPAELLQEALVISQWVTEGKIRARGLMQVASDWFTEGKLAVFALSRSVAASLLIDVAHLRKQSELVRSVLQSGVVPEAHALQAQQYMIAGSTLDELSVQMERLDKELQECTNPIDALGKLHLLRFLHQKASEELEKAPPIAIIPLEGEQNLGRTRFALSFDGEVVEDLLQEGEDEEQRREQTRKLRALLVVDVTAAVEAMSRRKLLSFNSETQRRLTEGSEKWFAKNLLPSRRLFNEWQATTEKMKEAEKAAKQATQRLAVEEDRLILQKTADEALQQAQLVASNAHAATRQWLWCNAWLKVEKALTRALNSYSKAFEIRQQQQQQQQQPQHQENPLSRLRDEAESSLRSGNIEAAARLAADVAEQARQIKLSSH
ncbi:hypothetical protein ACSSS7_002221 [Eimeria intestinalis]